MLAAVVSRREWARRIWEAQSVSRVRLRELLPDLELIFSKNELIKCTLEVVKKFEEEHSIVSEPESWQDPAE